MSISIKTCTRITALVLTLFVAVTFSMPAETHAARKPGKVKSLKVTSVKYNSVSLKWAKQKKAKKYEVYRASSKNGKYVKVKTTKGRSATSSGLKTGKTYWYKVRAVRGKKKGKFSAKVKGTPKLSKPSFTARSKTEGAELVAGSVKGATGYAFYRDGEKIKEQKGAVFIDKDIEPMESHSYKAVAYRNSDGKTYRSSLSRAVSAGKIDTKITEEGFISPKDKSPLEANMEYKLAGKIKSDKAPITGVEIGIVSANNNEWVGNQTYQNLSLPSGTMEIDLDEVNDYVHFDGLGGGSYRYRIYLHFGNGLILLWRNDSFSVKASYGAKAAVNWARMIANDNSFNYGTRGPANHRGCYYCKTFSVKKNHCKRKGIKWTKKWEKTYCCNPFILAAYAHGAKNAKVLAGCKKGHCGGMNPSDWTRYKCFVTVGKAKSVPFKDLREGDVIISKKTKKGETHHVWMYCGGKQLVEAAGGGWGAKSIAVKNNAKTKYAKYQKFSKCYVMRYTGK